MSHIEELAAEWRETADFWEQQADEDELRGSSYVRIPKGATALAPSQRKSDIRDWINWLRYCAAELEDASKRDREGAPW